MLAHPTTTTDVRSSRFDVALIMNGCNEEDLGIAKSNDTDYQRNYFQKYEKILKSANANFDLKNNITISSNSKIFFPTDRRFNVINMTNVSKGPMYIEVPSLSLQSMYGDVHGGKLQNVLAPIYSPIQSHVELMIVSGNDESRIVAQRNSYEPQTDNKIIINNDVLINLNKLHVRLIDSEGKPFKGLYGQTELSMLIEKNRERSMAMNLSKEIAEANYRKLNDSNLRPLMPKGQ